MAVVVVDDAFEDVDRIREHALRSEFGTMSGPEGAAYENMCFDVPAWLGTTLYSRLRQLVGPIEPYTIFFRLNTRETRIPHWAHTDSKLCDANALLYLSRDPPPGSGTAVVEHVSGLARHPETEEEYATWRRDHSRYEMWRVVDFAPMKYNRLVLIPADLLHAAMPPEGFGSGLEDGRLVLVTFFKELRT